MQKWLKKSKRLNSIELKFARLVHFSFLNINIVKLRVEKQFIHVFDLQRDGKKN